MSSHLNLEDGSTVYNSADIVHHAREYYRHLYSPEPVDVSAQDLLLSGLSQVSRDHSLECDRDISYDEVSCAAKQLNNSKAPGLDGLLAEFYIAFLGPNWKRFLLCFNILFKNRLVTIKLPTSSYYLDP